MAGFGFGLERLRKVQYATRMIVLFWVLVYVLVILQDYIYSALRDTSFYWSEVILFNCFWLLFIPLTLVERKLCSFVKFQNQSFITKGLFLTIFIIGFSALHLLIFSVLITFVSNIYFSPPHRFLSTLIASISNDLYFTAGTYFLAPYFFQSLKKKAPVINESPKKEVVKTLIVKQGNKQIPIDISDIYFFYSNKPYSGLYTETGKYLLDQSLKTIEKNLDGTQFLRVHRSTIVNQHFIKELVSRKNGDYDLIMKNDKTLRLSRHYRKNWEQLIMPST